MRISDWSSDVCSSDLDGYQGVIDRNIIPLLGRKKVHDVKRPDIAGLMEKLAYKPTEANKTFGVLRKMFNLAEVWGYRPDGTNPCRHVPMYPPGRSEEHTSELPSLMRISYAVFCLKKKKNTNTTQQPNT